MIKKIPIILVSLLMLLVPLCSFGSTFPDKPPSEHYYVDEAGLINPATGEQIDTTAAALLDEEKIPLYVVTISSLAGHDAVTQSISNSRMPLKRRNSAVC